MNTYDLIGKIYEPTGITLTDSEENKYPEIKAVEGYHVNMLDVEDMNLIQAYVVVPNSASRVFAGRTDAVYLKFVNRTQWLSLGIETIED